MTGTIDLAATPTYVPRRCDHRDDDQTFAMFEEIAAIHGRLDILVNTAWGVRDIDGKTPRPL